MKNLDLIIKNVNKEIEENTIMINYSIDLNDIPPFMCSPFLDGWFWSKNTNDIVKYTFEILIANYLLNDVMAFREFNNIGNKDYDFLESVDIYRRYKKMNEKREQSLNRVLEQYDMCIDQEISYKEMIKMFYVLEENLPYLGIELKVDTYSCPLETRHSKNLNTDKFDYNDLNNNY